MTATTTAAQAEDPEPEAPTGAPDSNAVDNQPDTIVVTGIRGALETARNIKRNSDTFVDSITASDVSTLPDLSVAEAIGRIPGVSVSRFPSGGASPDFPSAEGRGNLIRGLGYVRSEFNGRDAFSANRGRALDWSSIPPELVGAVDVFKNQTADLIEGGIGGTINLRTLEPFDRKGRVIAIALDGTYSDLRKKWSPQGSITLGDRWQTDAGEFGLMASYSKSILKSRIHGWQQNAPQPRVLGPDGVILERGDLTGENRLNEFVGVDPSRIIGTATGFQLRTNDVDRDRTSYYGAAQWRNDNIKATVKYVRAKTNIDNIERTFESWPDHNPSVQQGITNLVIDPRFSTQGSALCNGEGGFPSNPGDCETLLNIGGGLMESGFVTNSADSWIGAYGQQVSGLGLGGIEQALTRDISLNVEWDLNDRLSANFDVHRTKANAGYRQIRSGTTGWYNFNINHDLDDPTIELFIDPRHSLNPGNTRYLGDSDTNRLPSPTSSSDPNGTFWRYASDTFQKGNGDLHAARADFNYDLSGGDGATNWFKAVKFGARIAERNQTNREAAENWGSVSPEWAGVGIVGTFQDPSAFEAVDFSDFFRGGVVQGPNHNFIFMTADYLNDYSKFLQYMESEPQTAGRHDWQPRGSADGSRFGNANYPASSISEITETTKNAYARFDFGNEFGNEMSIDGNIGVRFVRTDLKSNGFRAFTPLNPDAIQPTFDPETGERVRTDDAEDRDDIRDFVPEAAVYASQAATEIGYKTKDTHWLPSFNVKWNLNREMLFRFGVSKAMSRPDVQDLRAAQTFVVNTSRLSYQPITDETDPLYGIDRGAQDISVSQVSVSGGNPLLKPTTAWNYDLSYEYYFKGGYFSAAAFLKKLRNIVENGSLDYGTTSIGGTTVPVRFNGRVNQSRARVRGFEVAYQQFYDFLPGILSNLGAQANYTFIDAKASAPGATPLDTDGDGVPNGGQLDYYRFGVDDLLGQSKHIANAVGIYQDDKLELRLAYNWRSKYLTTYRDYITGNPIYISPAGFLDASVKYQFTPQLQFRASMANLLDTKSKQESMLDARGTMYGRASFLNDRRLVVGVLAQF